MRIATPELHLQEREEKDVWCRYPSWEPWLCAETALRLFGPPPGAEPRLEVSTEPVPAWPAFIVTDSAYAVFETDADGRATSVLNPFVWLALFAQDHRLTGRTVWAGWKGTDGRDEEE